MIYPIIFIMFSFVLFLYAYKNYNILSSQKEIIKNVKLDTHLQNNFFLEFSIDQPKEYAISFIGCKDVGINDARFLLEKSNKSIELKTNLVKYNFFYKDRISIEYFNFLAKESGSYNLSIENVDRIKFFSSGLSSIQAISGSKRNTEDTLLLISSYVSPIKKITFILSIIIGLLFLSIGIIKTITYFN